MNILKNNIPIVRLIQYSNFVIRLIADAVIKNIY